MSRGMKKAERLREMERLYFQHREGLSDAELAERFDVDRTTVYRDRTQLECEIPLQEAAPGRYRVDRMRYISAVRLNLTEALALYLAARRMSRHTRTYQPHVVSALEKLAVALKDPMTEHLVHAATALVQQPPQPERERILETLTQGWAERIRVRLTYQGLRANRATTHLFSPYLIEPSIWSDAVYVIGHSDVFDALTTFNVERIQDAHLSSAQFTIPETFDEEKLLRFAWGIWTSQKEPVTVKLKFTGKIAITRLKESIWHPLQKPLVEMEDGAYIWEAPVAEPKEMLPWIRGWGASCEVLSPVSLREKIEREVRKMARVYGVGCGELVPLYQQLWGKAHKNTEEIHPLVCHMIDVAQVARVMWRQVLTSSFRTHIAEAIGLEEPEAERLIVFWVSLHDLGKACPGFQRKYDVAETELKEAGLPFPQIFSRERFYHGTASADLLPVLLTEKTNLPRRWVRGIARAVGGHHGSWPIAEELQALKTYNLGLEDWDKVRGELVDVLINLFSPPPIENTDAPREIRNTLFTLLSGLTSVADWVGSMDTYFPYTAPPVDIDRYAERAKRQAREALAALNWMAWQPPQQARAFCELFEVDSPRPMQSEVVELAEQLDQPALVIIEAPTGIGKTEAALYLADHWARVLHQRGMYVAMPTMATSNQMHDRVNKMLTHRYPDITIAPLLVHSQARWMQTRPPQDINIADEEIEDTAQALEAMSWFLPSKRSLLAPFGVGTVDQTFLSVLQTRHFFVRLFGLSHKTLIFDEVHAYDTYMSTLFQRLLGWLRAVGTSVVILSATLPAKTREELVRAYAGDDVEVPPAPYPTTTWAMDGRVGVIGAPEPEDDKPASPERTVELDWLARDPMMIAEQLQEALREGGCAAVICNTVRRSQDVYRVLREAKIVSDENLILFHARFPFGWRKRIEARVLKQFGKKGNRPHQAIVVATQVIEQSLDLDFDLMISDLAPVDLLIQRAGRLHRHGGRDRPQPLSEPQLWITKPNIKNGTPDFGNDKWVYELYFLLRSYLALQGRTRWSLPTDTRDLIEAVYGPDEPATGDFAYLLPEARRKMQGHNTEDTDKARQKLVLAPDHRRLLKQSNAGLQEDAPEVHKAFRALTRLGLPSVSVVCLHKIDGRLNTEPDGSGAWINLSQRPDAKTTQALVDATVSISHPKIFSYLVGTDNKASPSGWRRHALLKNYYVLEFQQNNCPIDKIGYTLILNQSLGLDIVKEAS